MEARIAQIIVGLAEYYDKSLSENQIAMYVEDLLEVNQADLNQAVKNYRNDPKNNFFPVPAKLKEIIQSFDGRPGVEEAWAIAPKSDGAAAYVNEEIMGAWTAANNLIQERGDMFAARMTFKEVYDRTVKDNRAKGIKPRWWLTRAFGQGSERVNEAALREAVEKKRLSVEDAIVLLPTFAPSNSDQLQLSQSQEVKKLISSAMKGIE